MSYRIAPKDWPPFLAVTSKKVVLVSSKSQYTLHKSDVMLYGLTWDGNHIYVSTRHDPEEKQRSRVLQFNAGMGLERKLPIRGLGRDVHQLFVDNGTLYICNTDEGNIIAYDIADGSQHKIRWTHDDVHLNCIWKYGSFFYVLEHRHNNTPKAIAVFDFEWNPVVRQPVHTGTQTAEFGYGVHNIYIIGGEYVTLGPYTVFKVNTDSGEPATTQQRIDGISAGHDYLRGLAALPGQYLLVGSSHLSPGTHRGEGNARVLLADLEFNRLDEFTLKDVGQVLSIRLLRDDAAHHSLPCPYQPNLR
jgi:hypothetical protein